MALIPELTGPRPWRRVLQRLLPPGPIWDLDTQPALSAAADAMVGVLNQGNNAVRLFVLQAFPSTVTYMLDDWIAALGLPWPCGSIPATEADKRVLIAGRLAAQGGQRPAYYVDIAAAMGIGIQVIEWPRGFPSRFGTARFGTSRFGVEAQMHEWEVRAPAALSGDERTRLECIIRAFAPAHTVVSFSYIL